MKSSDLSINQVSEAEATGEIAACYADIRATLGVPVVNLIWRHVATYPGCLDWAWQALKPVYATGVIQSEAAKLRSAVCIKLRSKLHSSSLAAVGLGHDDFLAIDNVLRSYNRSNGYNLLSVGALATALTGPPTDGAKVKVTELVEQPLHDSLPAMLALDDMTVASRALVEEINRIGGRSEVLPSMLRQLAHWPSFLALQHRVIEGYEADGSLEKKIQLVLEDSKQRSANIVGGLAIEGAPLPETAKSQMTDVFELFIGGLGKMTIVARLMAEAMPVRD